MNDLMYIIWSQSTEIFRIGPFALRWYSLLFVMSFIVGYEIMRRIFRDEGKPEKDLDSLTFYMIIGTVLGARIGHCLFYAPEYYLANPLEILQVWQGGLASHGAAIGILMSLWIFVKKKKIYDYLWMLDRIVIVVALSGLFIRTGNFFNSEILGKPTNSPLGVIFTSFDPLPRHPAQLYEAFAYLLLFIALYWLYKKSKGAPPRGRLFGIFLIVCFSSRFLLEFLKETQVSFEKTLPLDMGQILSIPLVIAGIYFLAKSYKNKEIEKPTIS